ncbi:hypothetical protein N9V96_02965, partial [Polaribacter sp.]|nr:hypothetical protein [Polaribacter sp.]
MKQILLFSILLILFSCGKTAKEKNEEQIEKELSNKQKSHNVVLDIEKRFENQVGDWEELNNVEVFIKRFQKISTHEAIASATDLSDLSKSLKDSVIPEKFNIPELKARINIFYNETLRFADMSNIENILEKEEDNQINKIIN